MHLHPPETLICNFNYHPDLRSQFDVSTVRGFTQPPADVSAITACRVWRSYMKPDPLPKTSLSPRHQPNHSERIQVTKHRVNTHTHGHAAMSFSTRTRHESCCMGSPLCDAADAEGVREERRAGMGIPPPPPTFSVRNHPACRHALCIIHSHTRCLNNSL